jgi:hypothetical protein
MILLDTDHTTFLKYPDSERARGEKAMQTIRAMEKTGKDGMLSLRIPLGAPETEYEVLVVVQPKAATTTPEERGWPPGYFDLAGSIDDETFVRPPQG